MKNIKDFDLRGKRVLIRVDFNVPIKDGVITDDNRIVSSLETINYALEKGSKVFIYTDGVPESSSGQNMFGIERMLDSLNKHEDLAPDGIIHGMSEDIDKFVGGKAQFDDTTMLCVEFKGYENE